MKLNLTEEIQKYRSILDESSGRINFEGILCTLDEPSDNFPVGSRQHKVLVRSDAAKKGLSTLIGAPVNYKPDWSGHNMNVTIGLITKAFIDGSNLKVRGYLMLAKYPKILEEIEAIPSGLLGMSYEMENVTCKDIRQPIWELTKVNFSGASILLRSKAAYANTSFRILRKEF